MTLKTKKQQQRVSITMGKCNVTFETLIETKISITNGKMLHKTHNNKHNTLNVNRNKDINNKWDTLSVNGFQIEMGKCNLKLENKESQ